MAQSGRREKAFVGEREHERPQRSDLNQHDGSTEVTDIAAKMRRIEELKALVLAKQQHNSATSSSKVSRSFQGECRRCYTKGHREKDCDQQKPVFCLLQSANESEKFFDRTMKTKDMHIVDSHTAALFVDAMNTHPDPAQVLFRLLNGHQEYGQQRLREAIACDISETHFKNTTIVLATFLSSARLSNLMYQTEIDKIILLLYETPGYVDVLAQASSAFKLSDDHFSHVAWLLKRLVLCHDGARTDKRLHMLASNLIQMGCASAAEVCTIVPTHNSTVAARMKIDDLPGGRHDNDAADFRKIALAPTLSEVQFQGTGYLPLEGGANQFLEDKQAHHLDALFRLLREDVLGPLREKILPKAGSSHASALHGAKFVGIHLSPRPHVKVNFRTPNKIRTWSRAKQMKFWEDGKILSQNSIICFEQEGVPTLVGRVVVRDAGRLTDEQEIGVMFAGNDLRTALCRINSLKWDSMCLVEAATNFFTYEPMLKVLQKMCKVPFCEELLYASPPQSVSYGSAHDWQGVQRDYVTEAETLDSSQRDAVWHALTHRVSLIQGPPGTGKTRIGVLLAKILMKNIPDAKLLCLSYKNHALDQFLERLVDAGVTDKIVRIGSRCNNPKIQGFELQTLANAVSFSSEQKRHHYFLKQQLQTLETEFEQHSGFMAMDRLHWRRAQEHLVVHGRKILEQFTVPTATDGFATVDEHGKKIRENYLWDRWRAGNDVGVFRHLGGQPMWLLSRQERTALIDKWLLQVKEAMVRPMQILMERYQELLDLKLNMRRTGDMAVLQAAKVIGCTTFGATSRKDLLETAGAKILIVEEAAEILESHILTSIGDTIEHIIMIGDHKQLRPRVECHNLSVESGNGYALNRSLFERLVRANFPYNTLQVQHRMLPELSSLVRTFTYPDLCDATSVKSYPGIRGVKHPIVFIDHTHAENADHEDNTRLEAQSTSKVNLHEAAMVADVVKYLLQQGYAPTQLVVLTPYLGQARVVMERLEKVCSVVVGELDKTDMANNGMDLTDIDTLTWSDMSVRVATIDNYQGEESDVVVASLVRSNSFGSYGHLQEPQRTNVLLSRARHGLIMIGNADFWSACNKQNKMNWGKLLRMLRAKQWVCSGLPVTCQRHPGTAAERVLSNSSDFATEAPDGGCKLRCNSTLACGHKCPRFCHGYDSRHKSVKCTIVVSDACRESGHKITRECSVNVDDVTCRTCVALRRKAAELENAQQQRAKSAERESLEQALRQADEKIAAIRSLPWQEVRSQELAPDGPDALEYNMVRDTVERSGVHVFALVVSKIEKVTNSLLELSWHQARKEMMDPTTEPQKLFHGASLENTQKIVEGGFKLPGRKKENMFGQCVYFAPNSTKSANEVYTQGSQRLLLCDVLLGKTCIVPGLSGTFLLQGHVQPNGNRSFLDVDKQKVREAGFDSVYAIRNTRNAGGVLFDEMCVYDERLALPRYIVHFGTSSILSTASLALTKTTKIYPNKSAHSSPEDMAFRIAESQFLRMLHARNATIAKVVCVEFCYNEHLSRQFEKVRAEYDRCYGKDKHETRLAFHGTSEASIAKITQVGFKLDRVGSAAGSLYGAGTYFSANTAKSLNYDQTKSRLLLCELLLGKPYTWVGGPRRSVPCELGFNCHIVRDEDEIVMFNMKAILPKYIIHYE